MKSGASKKAIAIAAAAVGVCCAAACLIALIAGASSDQKLVSQIAPAGLVGFEVDETAVSVDAEAIERQMSDPLVGVQTALAQKRAAAREMAAAAGTDPVPTQGAYASLSRSDMAPVQPDQEGSAYYAGQVLVLFEQGADAESAKSALAEAGLEADDAHIQGSLAAGSPLMACAQGDRTAASVLDELRQTDCASAISYAQPNFAYELEQGVHGAADQDASASAAPARGASALSAAASRAMQIQSTAVNDSVFNQWYAFSYKNCYVKEAWDTARCEGSVAVAIIDNGVADHPDLVDNIIPGTGYNSFYDDDRYQGTWAGHAADDYHGTHVAGIVSACANNGIGVAGLSYNAGLIPIDVAYRTGSTFHTPTFSIASALGYLLEDADGNGVSDLVEQHNLRVVNISIGARNTDETWDMTSDRMIFPLIDRLYEQGVLVVCAAGNDGLQNQGLVNAITPGDYDACMSVIDVFSYDDVIKRASTSNYGDLKDISAPGQAIYSTTYSYDGNGDLVYRYDAMWGTSMASPAVAGAAALVFSVDPSFTPDQVRDILQSTATDAGEPGFDVEFAWGMLNVQAAVEKAVRIAEGGAEPDPTPPEPMRISVPHAVEGLVYNGAVQRGVPDGEGYAVAAGTARDAGAYAATVTLEPGYVWEDGTADAKSIPFRISPATLTAVYIGEAVPAGATPAYAVSVSGFAAQEGPESAEGYVAPAIVPPAQLMPDSSYALAPAGGAAKNYQFRYVSGILLVEPLVAEAAPQLRIDFAAEALVGFTPGAAYMIEGRRQVVESVSLSLEEGQLGTSMRVAKAGDQVATADSPEVQVDIPARPTISAGSLIVSNETVQGRADGCIQGVTSAMEYRACGEEDWRACPEGSADSLEPGRYEVRLQSTATAFSGRPVLLEVGTGAEQTRVVSVAAIVCASAEYGYGAQAAYPIAVANGGNSAASVEAVMLEGEGAHAFSLEGSLGVIEPGTSVATLWVKPCAGLDAGTYQAEVVVLHDGGQRASAEASFRVAPCALSAPSLSIDFEAEMFCGFDDDQAYVVNGQEQQPRSGVLPVQESMMGSTVTFAAKAADANHVDSITVRLEVPVRPAKVAVTVRDESVREAHDGALLGTTTQMEYRLVADQAWKPCENDLVEGLQPGIYLVRSKAAPDRFAGEPEAVIVLAGEKQPEPVDPDPEDPADPEPSDPDPSNPDPEPSGPMPPAIDASSSSSSATSTPSGSASPSSSSSADVNRPAASSSASAGASTSGASSASDPGVAPLGQTGSSGRSVTDQVRTAAAAAQSRAGTTPAAGEADESVTASAAESEVDGGAASEPGHPLVGKLPETGSEGAAASQSGSAASVAGAQGAPAEDEGFPIALVIVAVAIGGCAAAAATGCFLRLRRPKP